MNDGNVEAALRKSISHLEGEKDVSTEIITLSGKKINGCAHCNWCIKEQIEGKLCIQEDAMDGIYPKILEADGVLLATPVHFGRLSGLLANMIDRLRVFLYGRVYRNRLRNKIGGAMAVGFFRGGGIETTLNSIDSVFFIFQMIVATSRMYQLGGACLSSVDGKGEVRKGVRHMAVEDEFGSASNRQLAERMLELARIVKAGEQHL